MPVFQLSDAPIFPLPSLAETNGLLAVGGDLSPQRLLEAYKLGIFPWFSEGDPLLWWFTSPRLILIPSQIKISKRLVRYIRKPLFSVTFDHTFKEVIDGCASIRQNKGQETWITQEMKNAYAQLHSLGYAHSVECWKNGQLVGGLYGVTLGKVFFGESMFSLHDNASKVALAALASLLQQNGFQLIDCQMTTDHLLQFGAKEVTGTTFSKLLRQYIQDISPEGLWKNEKFIPY